MVTLVWLFWLVSIPVDYFGYNFETDAGTVVEPYHLFFIALGVTIVAILWGGSHFWRACYLAQYGVVTSAFVEKTFGSSEYGMDAVTVTYVFNGKSYNAKFGVDQGSCPVGTEIEVLVDPQAPRRALLLQHILPPEAILEMRQHPDDEESIEQPPD